jgi:hypothetical protein
VRRRDKPFVFTNAALDEVQVRLQIPHAFRHGVIFVHLNLERILPRKGRNCEQHQREKTSHVDLSYAKS